MVDPASHKHSPKIRPIGRAVGVRIFSDACATDGRIAAVAFSADPRNEYAVLLKGAAEGALIKSLQRTIGISKLEIFATVAAVGASGEQLRKRGLPCSWGITRQPAH